MRFQHLGYALLLAVPLAACKGNDSAPAEATHTVIESSAAADPALNSVFPAKSGIIEWQGNLSGEMTTTLYFDDYGAKRATYTTTVMGQRRFTAHNVEIEADGWIILYDPDDRTGSRLRRMGTRPLAASAGITEISGDSPEVGRLEPRTILGKEARGYARDDGRRVIRSWVWEKIPMRTEMERPSGEPMVMEVTRVELDVPIPADRFAVPADVVITDLGS